MAFIGLDLGFAGDLLQVFLLHSCCKSFIFFFALLFGASQFNLLLVLHFSDLSFSGTGFVALFSNSTMGLNRPHFARIIGPIEGFLCLLLLLAHLDLLFPEFIVCLHRFPLDPLLPLLFGIVVPDLLVELFTLTSKLINT